MIDPAEATATKAPIENASDLGHALLGQIDIVGIIFSGIVIFMAVLLWRRQRDKEGDYKEFDLTDTIMEGGRVSRQALFEYGAFIATTFVLIHQEFKNVITDWYVAAYGGFWIIKGLARVWRGAPTEPEKEEKP